MITIQSAIDDFLVAALADGLSPATIKHYKSKLGRVSQFIGDRELASITTNDLRQYIIGMREQTERYIDASNKPTQDGGYSLETVNTHIRVLHRFFKWCGEEYDKPNPMSRIRYPQPAKQTPKGIASDDIVKLLQACGDNEAGIRDRAVVAFLADTGARLGGLIGLTLDKLFLPKMQAMVTEKGSKPRMVKYTRFTDQLLRLWLDHRQSHSPYLFTSMNTGEGLTDSGIALILKRLKKRAGIQGRVNPHSFRHGFAREFILNGGDIVVLSKLLGHNNINTTAAFYAIFTEDELAQMHAQFSPLSKF
jgi:integrase/recombinase XerD